MNNLQNSTESNDQVVQRDSELAYGYNPPFTEEEIGKVVRIAMRFGLRNEDPSSTAEAINTVIYSGEESISLVHDQDTAITGYKIGPYTVLATENNASRPSAARRLNDAGEEKDHKIKLLNKALGLFLRTVNPSLKTDNGPSISM